MSLRRSGAALNLQALAVSACPSASVTGKTYFGFYHDNTSDILYLWSYLDGAYDSDVSSVAYPSGAIYSGPEYNSVCHPEGSNVIAFMASVEGVMHLYSWNYVGATLASTAIGNGLGVASTATHLYVTSDGGQVTRFDLDLSNPTDIGDAFYNQGLWVASDSALYSQRDDGGQKLGHHDGATPADPWTLTSRDLIADGGTYQNLGIGSSTADLSTLVRCHGVSGLTTLNVASGPETPIWPSHWPKLRVYMGVGNDDVVVYDGTGFARLPLTDYSGVGVSCAWPSIEVEQHPVALAVPGAFIPLD